QGPLRRVVLPAGPHVGRRPASAVGGARRGHRRRRLRARPVPRGDHRRPHPPDLPPRAPPPGGPPPREPVRPRPPPRPPPPRRVTSEREASARRGEFGARTSRRPAGWHGDGADVVAPRPPAYPAEDLYGIVSADARLPFAVIEVIARLVDGSDFAEFKPDWGS